MQLELEFCQKHPYQKIKYFCFNKFCQIESKVLCEQCFIEVEHQECLQNQQIISKKTFTEKINEKLSSFAHEDQELELLNKCANRFSEICLQFLKKVKQSVEGSYYLNQFLKKFQMFQSSDSLKEILENKNFSDNQLFEQELLQPTVEIYQELENILNKMIEVSESRFSMNHQFKEKPKEIYEISSDENIEEGQKEIQIQTQELELEKRLEVSNQDRKFIRIKVSNKQALHNKTPPQNDESVNKQEFKINKQNEKLNTLVQQLNESLEVGEIEQQVQNNNPTITIEENIMNSSINKLTKLDEVLITNEPIKCIKVLENNILLIKTKFQLKLVELNFEGEGVTSNIQTLFTNNHQILDFKISNSLDNECIVQTKDFILHLINIKTKQIRHLIKASSKYYCYTSRKIQASFIYLEQKQLYTFYPTKKIFQKYILTGDECVMEQQQTINEPGNLLNMVLQGEFIQFSFTNGRVQLYNMNDLQFHSKFDLGLDSSAIDILIKDKYICILQENQFIIKNRNQQIIEKFRINENIRQYSHFATQENQLMTCFIAQSGAFNIFTKDLCEDITNDCELKTLSLPYQHEHHQSKDKNYVLFFSTAFHQNQQKEPLLFLGSSIGSVFIYKINNSNTKQ